jgi:hypothetical protein
VTASLCFVQGFIVRDLCEQALALLVDNIVLGLN